MSTPRTDGIEGEAYQYKWDLMVVPASFARQLETELAEMTKERDESIQVSARIASERACLMIELKSEREKVAKLRDAVSNFTHKEIGEMLCICGNRDGDECSAAIAEKALEQTK